MIKEGRMNKGGRNKKPSCPRPSNPPKGQDGRQTMSDELGREELLDELGQAFSCKLADAWQYPSRKPEIEQAHKQIVALIQSHPNLKQDVAQGQDNLKNKSLMKLAQDLGVSFSAAKIISDYAQPEVTEEWIEEKADELSEMSCYSCGQGEAFSIATPQAEGFIRSLVESIPAKKATVDEEFIEEKAKQLFQESKEGSFSIKSFCNFFIRKIIEEIRK